MRPPARRAATSAEQLPQRSPGPSRAPFPLHGEGPGHAPAGGNFRGTATSACAGAEPCAVSFARRRTRKCAGGRQLPGNSYRSLRPGTRRAAADACRRPRVGTARHSWLSTRAGPRHAPRMHAEGPGECIARGRFRGTAPRPAQVGEIECSDPFGPNVRVSPYDHSRTPTMGSLILSGFKPCPA